MSKRVGFAGMALAALLQGSLAQAAIVSWLPSIKETAVGEVGYVDILFNRTFHDSGPLGAFDILIQFNPTVVAFDQSQSSLGPAGRENSGYLPDQLDCPGLPLTCPYWGSLGNIIGQTDPTDGTIELQQVSLAPSVDLAGQARGFLLARLAFEGLVLGATNLDMLRIDLSDADGNALSTTAVQPAHLAVVVPEPSGSLLTLFALLGCAWASRRLGGASARSLPGSPGCGQVRGVPWAPKRSPPIARRAVQVLKRTSLGSSGAAGAAPLRTAP